MGARTHARAPCPVQWNVALVCAEECLPFLGTNPMRTCTVSGFLLRPELVSGIFSVRFWWAFLAFLWTVTRFAPLPLTRPAAGTRTVTQTWLPTIFLPTTSTGQ